MNDNIQILPRNCVCVHRDHLISGCGPLVQVYNLDVDKDRSIPLSTIHCFHGYKTHVEWIRPIGDTGHLLVAGGRLVTVLHADELETDLTWVSSERIAELLSDVNQVYEVIGCTVTETLRFTVFMLTSLSRLVCYSIEAWDNLVDRKLEIRVTTLREINLSTCAPPVALSSTSFILFKQSRREARKTQLGELSDCVMGSSSTGDLIVKVSKRGFTYVFRSCNDKVLVSGLTLQESMKFSHRFPSHPALPMCVIVKTIEEDSRACGVDSHVIIIGYQDGVITFNNPFCEWRKMDAGCGPILSMFIHHDELWYVTQSGTLAGIIIPLDANSELHTVEYGLRGPKPAANKPFLSASCSFHSLVNPTTAILAIEETIRLYLLPGKKLPKRLVPEMKRMYEWPRPYDYVSCALTVFPHDLYAETSPRLLLAFCAREFVVFQVVPTDESMEETRPFTFCTAFLNINKNLLAIALPPPWMTWDSASDGHDLRIAVLGDEGVAVIGIELSRDGMVKNKRVLYSAQGNMKSEDKVRSLSIVYTAGRPECEVEWVSKMGTNERRTFLVPANKKKRVNVIKEFKTRSWETKVLTQSTPTQTAVSTPFIRFTRDSSEKETEMGKHWSIIGTRSGQLRVLDEEGRMIDEILVDKNDPITAITYLHILHKGCIHTQNDNGHSHYVDILILTSTARGKVALVIYRRDKLLLISTQSTCIQLPLNILCVEERMRMSSLRVVVVGRHTQTVIMCLKSVLPLLGKAEKTSDISLSSIPFRVEDSGTNKYLKKLMECNKERSKEIHRQNLAIERNRAKNERLRATIERNRATHERLSATIEKNKATIELLRGKIAA